MTGGDRPAHHRPEVACGVAGVGQYWLPAGVFSTTVLRMSEEPGCGAKEISGLVS